MSTATRVRPRRSGRLLCPLCAPWRRPLLCIALAVLAFGSRRNGVLGPNATVSRAHAPGVVISAAFPDGFLGGEPDEAIQLWNVGPGAVDLGGWSVGDGNGRAAFPHGTRLDAGERIWLGRDGDAFRTVFGRDADWCWGDPDGARALTTTALGPRLANSGDLIELQDARGAPMDALRYGDAPPPEDGGWSGAAVRAYGSPAVSAANQVLHRKLDPPSGRPIPDSDTAADWASDPADPSLGRRARHPGWDLEGNLLPIRGVAAGRWEVALAPDALNAFLLRHLAAARHDIDLMAYTFEHAGVADILADRASQGVRVRVLVDGSPAGGVSHDERWCLNRISQAGGAVYWHADGGDVKARYRSAHAKLAVVDGTWALFGSENPGPGSAPSDDRSDGTAGRRGVWIATDAKAVVAWARDVVARDIDPDGHPDVRPFQARDPRRGAPADDYVPDREGGGSGYEPRHSRPLTVTATLEVEMLSAPENALAPDNGLLGLLAAAGPGGEVLSEQLREPLWWGAGPDGGEAAANPRVQAYLQAARRGARVRVLLDAYFDEPGHWNANRATARWLNTRAAADGLDLEARCGNPTGKGIHNKMVLVRGAPGAGSCRAWAHVGSLNGSETAHKVNRELALQVCSPDIHAYLSAVFAWDWEHSPAEPLLLPWCGRSVPLSGRFAFERDHPLGALCP